MALSAQLMASMDDDHLVTALHAELDPLTSTAAEQELLTRFEALLDKQRDIKPVTDLLDEYEIPAADLDDVIKSHPGSFKDMAAILRLLDKAGIEEPDQLAEALELLSKFRAIANDLGENAARLFNLITTAQE